MKTYLLPLSLRLARAAARPALLSLPLLCAVSTVRAQDGAPRILFPQPNQDVRGEISARFENIPAGGYAIIKINGQFKTASAQDSYALDTIGDRVTFPEDAAYILEITAINAGGTAVGTSSVTFNVANQKVANTSESVRLVHWTPLDRLNDGVQRYRVFAESNADISQPSAGGAGGGGGGGGGRGGGASEGGGGASGGGGVEYIAAPLDWQVAILLRREVRDIYGLDGSANIATVVADAQQHQREGTGGGGAGGAGGAAPVKKPRKKRGAASSGATIKIKGPWMSTWSQGPELGKFYVKAIKQTGDEINATRKVTQIAIADLLPTFPTVPVRPGSTWQSRQTFLSDLSTREPIQTQGAITFTSYDNIQTPDGVSRRCAKLESRFPLPDSEAKKFAAKLGAKVGTGGAGGGGGASGGGASAGGPPSASIGGGASGGGAADNALLPEDIDVANLNIARVIWFDMDKHQVVRSEDTLTAYFEIPPASTGAGAEGGGAPGGGGGAFGGEGGAFGGGSGGASAAPAEPIKVNYRMNVTTWLDDRVPAPSIPYNGGAGTAHSRDNVRDVDLSRATSRAVTRR